MLRNNIWGIGVVLYVEPTVPNEPGQPAFGPVQTGWNRNRTGPAKGGRVG